MTKLFRKVIHISCEDSPNVMRSMKRIERGLEPDGKILVPGVVTYERFVRRRENWDSIKRETRLYGRFYKGREVMLFPPDSLEECCENARRLSEESRPLLRKALAIGVDSAEGGDGTVWTGVDREGIVFQDKLHTYDTSVIGPRTIGYINEHNVAHSKVVFDRGGGGKQHADNLRSGIYGGAKYLVSTLAFGEAATDPSKHRTGRKSREQKEVAEEVKTIYKNRRAEIYWLLRQRVLNGYGIPSKFKELLRQLSKIPLTYDPEGRFYLLPKSKRNESSKEKTLKELLGCSPDEADSWALANWALEKKENRAIAGMAIRRRKE